MIEIRQLSKTFGSQCVLDRVDLSIPDGCIFALLGPNGSGKTTLLKSILGVVVPSAGTQIMVNGGTALDGPDYRSTIGYMSQSPRFPPHVKVRELIQLLEKLRRQAVPLQEKLIHDLGIGQFWNKPLGFLSGGMTQKVNILQCFMFDPPTVILDEPTLELDPEISFYFKQMLKIRRDAGKTIVFTSHIMSEVEELADWMALLIEGNLYTVMPPAKFVSERKSATLEEALHYFWKEHGNH